MILLCNILHALLVEVTPRFLGSKEMAAVISVYVHCTDNVTHWRRRETVKAGRSVARPGQSRRPSAVLDNFSIDYCLVICDVRRNHTTLVFCKLWQKPMTHSHLEQQTECSRPTAVTLTVSAGWVNKKSARVTIAEVAERCPPTN